MPLVFSKANATLTAKHTGVNTTRFRRYPTFWGGAASGETLMWVAVIHTVFAFAIAAFVIIHVYLLTTGHSFKEHVMPMINGFDEVELSEAEEAYLEKDEPGHIQ